MPYVLRIEPLGDSWRLCVEDGDLIAVASRFETLERRARFLAARAAVRGSESEIHIYDAGGGYRGRWRAERFEPAVARLAA